MEMNKREEILKGLECCVPISSGHGNCGECPYYDACWNGSVSLPAAMVEDIRDILKTKPSRLEELADNYGLTPDGVEFALQQYQTVICEITHNRMSKLSYHANDILSFANDLHCEGCELKEAQEPIEADVKDSDGGTTHWYVCGTCQSPIQPGDKYCHECGKAVKWG